MKKMPFNLIFGIDGYGGGPMYYRRGSPSPLWKTGQEEKGRGRNAVWPKSLGIKFGRMGVIGWLLDVIHGNVYNRIIVNMDFMLGMVSNSFLKCGIRRLSKTEISNRNEEGSTISFL